MAAVNGLTVRRYERHEVGLPAVLSLTGSACHAVRFSATSETDGQGIPATLVDIGDGGLGVRTSVMLPRGTTLRVRVTHPQGNEQRFTWGHSMIVDPWGVILDRLPRGSGVVIASVNRGYQASLRTSLPALQHRTIHQC